MITYYLPESILTAREQRRESEKKIEKEGGEVTYLSNKQIYNTHKEEYLFFFLFLYASTILSHKLFGIVMSLLREWH